MFYRINLVLKTLNKQQTIINKQVKKLKMKKFDLEDRFTDFTIRISNIVDEIDNSKLGNHIAGQLIRSGNSPALNYGEAQSAESRKDFAIN